MGIGFKEFLRERAAEETGTAEAAAAAVADWRASIERLYALIGGWLADTDPNGAVRLGQRDCEIYEGGIGQYVVPRLDLRAFGKWVGVVPTALRTIGTARLPQRAAPERALGRVDITDELRRYLLYRFRDDAGEDLWMIDDGRGDESRPFTRERFEAALMGYFR